MPFYLAFLHPIKTFHRVFGSQKIFYTISGKNRCRSEKFTPALFYHLTYLSGFSVRSLNLSTIYALKWAF